MRGCAISDQPHRPQQTKRDTIIYAALERRTKKSIRNQAEQFLVGLEYLQTVVRAETVANPKPSIAVTLLHAQVTNVHITTWHADRHNLR
jgi:hypothetical protein